MLPAMKLALFGRGKMGRLIERLSALEGYKIVPPEIAEVAIDFSHASVVMEHIELCVGLNLPIVVGTTGWEEHLEEAKALVSTRGALLYSPNFSLGVALFKRLVATAQKLMPESYDVSLVEWHHKEKADAPSGTAKALQAVLGEVEVASVRCGSMPGTHEVSYDSACDTITLTHTARSREGFALGALRAAKWLSGKQGWFTFEDMVRDLYCAHHPV